MSQEDIAKWKAELEEYRKQGIYLEFGHSGTKGKRPEFIELMEDATEGRINAVFVWAVDRFTREGIKKFFEYISFFDKKKVAFLSFQEKIIDTSSEHGQIMLAVMAAMASLESKRQGERVKAGIQRAIKSGKYKIWGTPHTYSKEVEAKIIELREQGKGYLKISKELKALYNCDIKAASVRYYMLYIKPRQEAKAKAEAEAKAATDAATIPPSFSPLALYPPVPAPAP
jgi:DNA invertase Pin-like site-specific DNA recombinase